MVLAIEMDPGSSSFAVESPLFHAPADNAARTSSRVNQAASVISPSLKTNVWPGSAMAWNPTMRERGNGQG